MMAPMITTNDSAAGESIAAGVVFTLPGFLFLALAAYLKQTTQAPNRWIAERLSMGTPVSVSQLVGQARRRPGPAAKLLKELTETLKT